MLVGRLVVAFLAPLRAIPTLTIAYGFRSRAIVVVTLLLVSLVAVYAARQRSKPAEVSLTEATREPAVVDNQKRNNAAQLATCAAIQKAVNGTTTFNLTFYFEPLGDGSRRLTTAALNDGRQVDVRSVLRWDADRQAWYVLELYLGGTALPVDLIEN